jgi:hypothetical protein
MGMGGRATSTHMLIVGYARIRTAIIRLSLNVSRRHACKTETNPKSNMGMGGRATSTHRLIVDSARIRTAIVRETPNVNRRHACKTETKPRGATWEWAGGQLQLTH